MLFRIDDHADVGGVVVSRFLSLLIQVQVRD